MKSFLFWTFLPVAMVACHHHASTATPQQSQSLELQLGEEAFRRRDLDGALQHARSVLAVEPENGDASYLAGAVYLARCIESAAACSQAEGYSAAAVRNIPGSSDAKVQLASVLIAQKRYQAAEDVLEPLVRSGSGRRKASVARTMGLAQIGDGSVDEAIVSFGIALETANDDCVSLDGLKVAYLQKGAPLPPAVRDVERTASSTCPSDEHGWLRYGRQLVESR